MSRFLLLLLALPMLTIGLSACGDDGPSEDALVIYSGRNEDLVGPLMERFEQETGIETQIKYADSPELAATLIEEGKASPADVFFSQDAGALGALQNEQLLGPIPPATLDKVPEAFRSAEGDWVGTSARARVIAYDKRKLKPGDLPDSVLDLTAAEWKGRIAWAPTNASFQSFVTAMRAQLGQERTQAWLEGMLANDVQVYENNIAIRDAIANGEIEAGLLNHYYVAEAIAEEGDGYPVAIFEPAGGDIGALVNVAGVGILAGTNQRAAAERFAAFLLTRPSQEYFAEELKEYPVVPGVPADPSLQPLDEIEQPDIDLSQLNDLQGTVKLLQETGVL
jgi:iron(III) transport system substrate-binding protein